MYLDLNVIGNVLQLEMYFNWKCTSIGNAPQLKMVTGCN
jgi:hypothetical protein